MAAGDDMKFIDLEGRGLRDTGSLQAAAPAPPSLTTTAPSSVASSSSGGGSDASGWRQLVTAFYAAKHPRICLFHLVFKVAAFIAYLVGRHVLGDYVKTFIFSVIFTAFDFWTVKNITGRILVGLRWWNDIKDDGSSEWIFESMTDETILDPTDRGIFWSVLYIWPLLWLIFLVVNFLSLNWDWVLLIVIMIVFGCSNVVGYWKCSKDHKKRMAEWAKGRAMSSLVTLF